MSREYVLAVASLALVVLILFSLIAWVRNYRYRLIRYKEKGRGTPFSRKSFRTIICVFTAALLFSASALGYNVHNILVLAEVPASEEEAQGDGSELGADPGGPDPGQTGSEENSVFEPIGPVQSVEDLYPEYFHLSDIKNSNMLQLFEIISPDGMITAAGLEACAEEFRKYQERYVHPRQFYPFYEGLGEMLPKGDSTESFYDVTTYEECMPQIRGAGAKLQACKDSANSETIYNASYHLAIRAKDAVFFGTEGKIIAGRMTWILGEIAFSSLMNEWIYGNLAGPTRSDWHYRMAQIFEYLGDIADTDELQKQMYYLAAVCSFCAYGQIKDRGLSQTGGNFGSSIWETYFRVIYKVAIRVDDSSEKDFFEVILDGELDVEESDLPDEVAEETRKMLEDLDGYWLWRESPEGAAARERLIKCREAGIENE